MAQVHICKNDIFTKDLDKKTYIVTGANSGIGLITARQLAKQGAKVILACRRLDEAQKAIEKTKKEIPGSKMSAMKLDLGDTASIKDFAKSFTKQYKKLDGLVNNAGVMNTPKSNTKDGFEMQFGINHLGHYLLTELLLGTLKKTKNSRIVNVSSCFHDKAQGREGDIHFEDPNYKKRKYDGWEAYAQSKLANLLHAQHLAKQLKGKSVTAVSVHPGWVRTNLIRGTMPVWVQNTIMRPALKMMGMIEPWEGAQTSLYALLADDVKKHSGAYYSQLGVYRDKSFNKGGWPMQSPNPNATDDKAKKLDKLSKKLLGLK